MAELAAERGASTGLPLAVQLLERIYRDETRAALSPPTARAAVFRAAAGREPRALVLERVAAELGLARVALEEALFADLAGERRLRAPDAPIGPAQLVERANLEIAREALRCAAEVEIVLEGNARALVRHARLRGLICTVSAGEPSTLSISGPLALFRHTALYGRSLAELVPLLPWSRRFELTARCVVRGRAGAFPLKSGDPIPAGPEPRRYDSALERGFARDFARIADEWELVREPEPIPAAGALVFPDFLLRHRRDPSRRWLMEIAGFWTAEYLDRKLARLRAAGLERLILCIDAAKDCGARELPPTARVLRFEKRVDARAVLRILESG